MDRLNILVLHSLGDVNEAPIFLRNHVYLLRNHLPEHNYLYHDVAHPLPEYIKKVQFDLIVLDVTFLYCRMSAQHIFQRLKNEYSFIKDSEAIKIALPQDEYDCNQILDEWMVEWNIDIVFSVIAEHWPVLYPKYHRVGHIKLGYTGYLDESLIDWFAKPFNERVIDIGYRARKLLPYFGRIGEDKWKIGENLLLKVKQEPDLHVDILLGEGGFIHGVSWLNFLDNSKFTLGSNSGSSLLDPVGDIRRSVQLFLSKNRNASFEEVEKACFPGEEGRYEFTAISPRIIEASMVGSCQILVEGTYSKLISPWEDYIPIKNDASNWAEVREAMRDESLVCKMIESSRTKFLDTKQLRAKVRAQSIIEDVFFMLGKKNFTPSSDSVRLAIQRYSAEITPRQYVSIWRRRRVKRLLMGLLVNHPGLERIARGCYHKIRRWI